MIEGPQKPHALIEIRLGFLGRGGDAAVEIAETIE